MALGSFEAVVTQQRGTAGRAAVGAVAGLLLCAAVIAVALQPSSSVALGAAKSAIVAVDPRLAALAKDTDDRGGLQSLFKGMARQEKELKEASHFTMPVSDRKVEEQRRGETEAKVARMRRHEEQREMSTSSMVPWVHWPAANKAMAEKAVAVGKRTKLLQTTELYADASAKIMPLKEIMERLAVDKKLHRGYVSDTQLNAADDAARRAKAVKGQRQEDMGEKDARSSRKDADSACAPFC
ncbi:hypothetical protein T484DRAFT_1938355 [Baffinella frigidus]|nr:hypothetical protein T484DRAFT_1938355 [Cryptophyta sp. CCMP2293]